MGKVFAYVCIFILLSFTCYELNAQNRILISLGKIQGIPAKFLYCSGENETSYRLLIGKAKALKLVPSGIFIENLKRQIQKNSSRPLVFKKLKKQLKNLRSILKSKLLLCKTQIKSEFEQNSITPTPRAPEVLPTRIPTKAPLPSLTPTPITAICGNALVEPGEACDDGDTSNQNSCLNSCQNSFCGDGFLQTAERCIVDDPIATSYVEIKNRLKAQFCQKSVSDNTLISKQADLMNAVNLMLTQYLKDLSSDELASSLVGLRRETDALLANCQVSNFMPLSVDQLRNFIKAPTASTQTGLIAQNFQHLLVNMTCQNYPALEDYQFSYINYFEDFDVDTYNWYLDFIQKCDNFQSGRIYDIALDNAYSDGLNFQITYSSCDNISGFAPNSNWVGNNLKLSLIYPDLTLTCLEPPLLSKPVYVHTGSRQISQFNASFYGVEKEFKNIVQKPKVTNLIPQKSYIDLLPRTKTTIVPGMYDGFYSYPRSANNTDLPFQVIGLTNIADDLWRQLRQIAPPAVTTQMVNIFERYNYSPDPLPNEKSIWGRHPLISNLDFSGVAWENNKSGTLISRQHIVVAAHFRRDVEDTVMFHDRNGNPVVRKVVAIKSLERDICIAKLDSPVPAGVTHYKLLFNNIDIVGAPVIVTDRFKKVGIMQVYNVWQNHNISDDGSLYGTHDRSIGFIKPNNEYRDVNIGLTGGDSGHPTFLVLNGELVLVETHTTPLGGPNYSSFWNQEMIRKAIRDLN